MAFRKPSKPLAPVIAAVKAGNLAAVQAELDAGVSIETSNANNSTLLIVAAWNGHADIVKLLLERGAAIDHQNLDRKSALSQAMYRAREDIVRILLDAGAALDLTGLIGQDILGAYPRYWMTIEKERAMRSHAQLTQIANAIEAAAGEHVSQGAGRPLRPRLDDA